LGKVRKSNLVTNYFPLLSSLLILFISSATISTNFKRSEIIPALPDLIAFPTDFGQWKGHSILLDPEVRESLRLDDYLLSDYKSSDGETINLYVGYYSSQRQGESPHSPLVCIPGGGWQIINFKQTRYAAGGVELPFNRAVIERNSTKEIVYYWFDERGRQIASEYLAKWYVLKDAIVLNRTDGALVRLATQVHPGEPESQADKRLQEFMQVVSPRLAKYLPSGTALDLRASPDSAVDGL
jgi:EpsI family protein